MEPSGDATQLLNAGSEERLGQTVYDELRKMARGQLRGRRADPSLTTTALVHECYLRLIDQTQVDYETRTHFFATAAQAMRHLLVDRARRRTAQKRGSDAPHLGLDDATLAIDATPSLFLELDRALTQLAERDERLARIVECRFFGGMQHAEVAALLDVSTRTVRRDWRKAKAWLTRALPDGIEQHVS
jgi:RNA polymerase sigma factor (TIGR02999 family)